MSGNGGTGGVTARINGQVVVTNGDVKVDGIGVKSHVHKEQGDGNDVDLLRVNYGSNRHQNRKRALCVRLNRRPYLCERVDRVRQQVEFRLSLWAGEWFLDETFGTPYLLRILGKAAVSVDAAVDALRQQMLDVEGVQSINRLDYTFDVATRKLNIDVDLQSAYGVVKYQSAAQLANPPEDINRTAIDMSASVLDSRIVVNANAPHGVRGAGGYLVMTADGEYPAEMVNNVQVGRQLPMRPVTYMWSTGTVYTQVTRNDTLDDSPGAGSLASLSAPTLAAQPYLITSSNSTTCFQCR